VVSSFQLLAIFIWKQHIYKEPRGLSDRINTTDVAEELHKHFVITLLLLLLLISSCKTTLLAIRLVEMMFVE